jgi:hypothetical protein
MAKILGKNGVVSVVFQSLSTVLLFGYAYRGFFDSGMFSYGDNPPFPVSAPQAFSAFFSSWHPLDLGVVLPYSLTTFLQGLSIIFAGGDSALAQRVFSLLPLPLAFGTMYWFLGRLVNSSPARWLASFAYSINPVTIGAMLGGAIGMIYVHALAPLLVGSLVRMFAGKREIRTPLVFALCLALGASFGAYIVLYTLPFVLYLSFHVLRRHGTTHLLGLGLLGALSIGLSLLLTLPYTLYALPILSRFLLGGSVSSISPQDLSGFVGEISYTYSSSSALNILKFGSTSLPFLGYLTNNSWSVLGLAYPLLAFLPTLFKYDHRIKIAVVGFSTFAVSIASLIWLVQLGVGLRLYTLLPSLFVFSNPSGLNLMLVFAYAPLMAISFETVERIIRNHRMAIVKSNRRPSIASKRVAQPGAFAMLFLILLILGAYNWPFFTGDLSFSLAGRSVAQSEIPKVFYDASHWLDNRRTPDSYFRTLWLPLDYSTQLAIRWLDPNSLTVPLGTEQYLDLSISKPISYVFSALSNGDTNNVGALLAYLDVRYVVVNMQSQETGPVRSSGFLNYKTPFIYGAPQAFVDILSKQSDLAIVYRTDSFQVYENERVLPNVVAYQRAFYLTSNVSNESGLSSQLWGMTRLSALPSFNPSSQLLVLSALLSPPQQDSMRQFASTIVLSNVTSTQSSIISVNNSQDVISISPLTLAQKLAYRDAGDNLTNWSIIRGSWQIQQGALHQNETTIARALAVAGNATWTNYDVSTRFQLPSQISGGQSLGLVFRYNNGTSYYEAWLYANQMAIRLVNKGNSYLLANTYNVPSIAPNTWHNLEVLAYGSTFEFYLDEKLYLTSSDPTYSQGGIGLTTYDSSAYFNNIQVNLLLPRSSFPAPFTGKYILVLPGNTTNSISVYLDGEPSDVTWTREANWYTSSALYLSQGQHYVQMSGDNFQSSDALIAYSLRTNSTLAQLLASGSESPRVQFQRVSQTEYSAEASSNQSFFLSIGEIYNRDWNGYEGGRRLFHFPAFYGTNGFYIENGGHLFVRVTFDQQTLKNDALVIWVISWTTLLGVLSWNYKGKLRDLQVRMTRRDRTSHIASHDKEHRSAPSETSSEDIGDRC